MYENNNQSNRLITVTDSSQDYRGYPDTSGIAMTYDQNGNMKNHEDKGILQIDYNFLNLPNNVKFNDYIFTRNGKIYVNTSYLYRADGIKVRKQHKYKDSISASSLIGKNTDYLDGFQYEENLPLNPVQLKFVPTLQ